MNKRLLLSSVLLLATLLLTALTLGDAFPRERDIPVPVFQAVVLDPFDEPLLQDYKLYRDAVMVNDLSSLTRLADSETGYLQYRSALTLARNVGVSAIERLRFYDTALRLRIEDPLTAADKRQLYLEQAVVAEQAGLAPQAIAAYTEALPEAGAVEGLKSTLR